MEVFSDLFGRLLFQLYYTIGKWRAADVPSSVPGVVTGGTKYWLRDEYQNVVTFDVEGSAEPVKCCFSLEIKAGALQLVKTSEDGKVEGIPFHISGNGVEKDVVTGPDTHFSVSHVLSNQQ